MKQQHCIVLYTCSHCTLFYYCTHALGAVEGADAAGSTLTLWLVDTVSGRLLHRLQHQGAAGPVHCVVSENNVVCTHWSAKARRTEVSALHAYSYCDR
jgi:ER membrane protein complex subunit 1